MSELHQELLYMHAPHSTDNVTSAMQLLVLCVSDELPFWFYYSNDCCFSYVMYSSNAEDLISSKLEVPLSVRRL